MPAWSFSALNSYETCPRRHQETRVLKRVRESEGAPLLLGKAAHKMLELRAANGTPIPKTLQVSSAAGETVSIRTDGWEHVMKRLLAVEGDVIIEKQIALDDKFCEVPWFDKRVWVRGVVDLGFVNGASAFALDHKLGKRKLDHDQLMLFAVLLMHVYPQLEKVVTGYIWWKTGQIDKKTFTRADVPDIWNQLMPRVRRFEQAYKDDKWEPKPSGLCKKWCPVHSCSYNGKYTG